MNLRLWMNEYIRGWAPPWMDEVISENTIHGIHRRSLAKDNEWNFEWIMNELNARMSTWNVERM